MHIVDERCMTVGIVLTVCFRLRRRQEYRRHICYVCETPSHDLRPSNAASMANVASRHQHHASSCSQRLTHFFSRSLSSDSNSRSSEKPLRHILRHSAGAWYWALLGSLQGLEGLRITTLVPGNISMRSMAVMSPFPYSYKIIVNLSIRSLARSMRS